MLRTLSRSLVGARRSAACAASPLSALIGGRTRGFANGFGDPNATQPMSGPSSDTQNSRTIKMKPTSPGQRHYVKLDRSNLWKGRPHLPLTSALRKKGGRNNTGRITVRHRGGGHRRRYRHVDFRRSIQDVPGTVERIEYDPNRSAEIALVSYPGVPAEDAAPDAPVDPLMQYIIAPQHLAPGDVVQATRGEAQLKIQPGNSMPLSLMPLGTSVHNVELRPGKGGQLARSAGTFCEVADKQMKRGYVLLKMQSQEQRLVREECVATVGAVSNPLHKLRKLGKAGRARWLGRRPHVRGVAMNPVDHPMGGGEGKSSGGRPSCSPTGMLSKGFKTRNKKKHSGKYIYQTRQKATARR